MPLAEIPSQNDRIARHFDLHNSSVLNKQKQETLAISQGGRR